MNIPKIIHYCWFGRNDLSEEAKRCIESWKKFCPEYEIKEWNETNFDINCCQYVQEAYEAKKWAFVSDYARFWILYKYGGLYFDTDVELIHGISDIVERGPFMGGEPFGCNSYRIAAGLGLGAYQGQSVYKEILDYYSQQKFYISKGVYNDTTIVTHITKLMRKYGFVGDGSIEEVSGIFVYPPEYFCPLNADTLEMTTTVNTRSIHWYSASWKDVKEKQIHDKATSIYNKMPNRMGKIVSFIYENTRKCLYYVGKEGVVSALRRVFRKLKG